MINFKSMIVISIFFSLSLFANENNKSNVSDTNITAKLSDSNVSKDAIFSLNKKLYTTKDFPKTYEKLSKKRQESFISQYIYYTLLSKSLLNETKQYETEIKSAIKKREEDFNKKGIVLNEIDKLILDKKVVTDTIGYQIILKKHPKIKSEIEDFYKKNKEGFKLPNRATISHIVLKDENLSKKLLNELNASKSVKKFSQYALKHSLHKKTKYSGGYVGEVSAKSIGEALFKTIWNAKEKGLVPQVLKNKERFHLVYLFEKKKAEQRTIEDEKKNIEAYLLKKEIHQWEIKRVLKLKEKAEVIHYQK